MRSTPAEGGRREAGGRNEGREREGVGELTVWGREKSGERERGSDGAQHSQPSTGHSLLHERAEPLLRNYEKAF